MASPSASITKPPKKVLYAPASPDVKVLYTRFCKKGTECERVATGECAFAHTFEMLNPVLCAHEDTHAGCSRRDVCVFMHTNESKYTYVMRACADDVARLKIDLSQVSDADKVPLSLPLPEIVPTKIGISSKTTEQGAVTIRSAYAELCEKTKHFKESWADMDEEDRRYEVTKEQLKLDPEFPGMNEYNRRTLFRIWGDGTVQANRGDGVFEIIEKDGEIRRNMYDVLYSVPPVDLPETPPDSPRNSHSSHAPSQKGSRSVHKKRKAEKKK